MKRCRSRFFRLMKMSVLGRFALLAILFSQCDTLTAAPTVELLRDPWGTPHVFATTETDGFFGLGYAAAEDRLLQMDLIRRKAAGRLAGQRAEIHHRQTDPRKRSATAAVVAAVLLRIPPRRRED